MANKTLSSHVWRFLRNCLTGAVATIVYFAIYLPLHHWAGWTQGASDNAGLVVGAVVQFIGARYFVFKAGSGKLGRQLGGFALAEAATLLMNVALLWLARMVLPAQVGQSDLLVLVTSFAVFAGFSYPIWHLVFRRTKKEAAPEGAAS